MRFCYADPPYIGQAKACYGGVRPDRPAQDVDHVAEVDHELLIASLVEDFPDGWALSCSTPSLQQILSYCPPKVRVAAWVKPFCSFKPNVNPAYAWEPVVWMGGRKIGKERDTVRDWVAANITLEKGLCGAKPPAFCWWLFDLLGMDPGDDLVDLFPGSGAVTEAFEHWTRANSREQVPLFGVAG